MTVTCGGCGDHREAAQSGAMDSALTLVGLPIALGIIMLGLGLGLTVDDFRRVARLSEGRPSSPWSARSLVLPALCFGLVLAVRPGAANWRSA